MSPECEQRIAEIMTEQPQWSGEQIVKKLKKEMVNAPGRSAIYECFRRLKQGLIPGGSKGIKVLSDHIKALEQEKTDLKKTVEQLARARESQYTIPAHSNTIRFGVVGDTHIGSAYTRFDALKTFYARLKKDGIKDVLHTGDMLAGWKVYPGQEWELVDRGWEEQLDRLSSEYPLHVGIHTSFITGNHDHSFKKPIGINVGDKISALRPDLHFIAEDQGRVVFKAKSGAEWIVDLLHPGGGTAYALSYHPQKIVESLSGGTKPNMIAIGHYHKAELIPQYRNVVTIQSGTFESQTPFMKRKHLAAHVGGWIVEVVAGAAPECLVNTVKAQFISFFEPTEGQE